MALLSTNINSGHCQGIIAGDVFSPKEGVALVTLKVKGSKPDPETKKRPLNFIQFIAYVSFCTKHGRANCKYDAIHVNYSFGILPVVG